MTEPLVEAQRGVPFVELSAMHEPLAGALLSDLAALVESGQFTNGPAVAEFEHAFAAYCGAPHCVGTASGLDALRLALVARGIEAGDEVIVPANTFIATFEAVTQAGGIPVPVDATRTDYNLDVEAAGAAVSARTRFLIPVHLYGQLADMSAVLALAREKDLIVIEDACQAHGAVRDGHRAGASSFAGCFSFYPAKNLGAFGDAGALVTADAELAETVRALREHGQVGKYKHEHIGWTSRLDTLQAIVLLHKLPLLDEWNAERQRQAAFYTEALAGVGDLVLPPVAPGSTPVWHVYVIATELRDALAAWLRERGIGTGIHYPEPPHLSRAYRHLGYESGSFPVAERLAERALSLPVYPGLRQDQLERVVAAIDDFFRDG
jgi:dTDP-3-amino-3,4,6-trideoxy-alpha-D-glucose transaminase